MFPGHFIARGNGFDMSAAIHGEGVAPTGLDPVKVEAEGRLAVAFRAGPLLRITRGAEGGQRTVREEVSFADGFNQNYRVIDVAE